MPGPWLRDELVWPETSHSDPDEARKRLIRLRDAVVYDSELCVPLLLAARARCDEGKFAMLVQMLETFAFR